MGERKLAVNGISITKVFETGTVYVKALDNVSIEIMQGEFVAIVGASGSGKTTMLNILGGLVRPTKGMVYINDISIWDLNEEERTIFRREQIGFVFQKFNLIQFLNVYENIVLPLKLGKKEIDHEFVEQLISTLELKDQLLQMPETLSGGQQQRVAIARALVTRPAILFADEPTGNLDSKMGNEVIDLIQILAKELHQTVAIITHSEEVASKADRIIRVMDGKIEE
jgi:putative ABC transport system ATP-binding protein